MSDKDIQNFVPEELEKKRMDVAEEWKNEPQNMKLNMANLILSINTLIPPLRLNFADMEVYPYRIVDGRPTKPVPTKTPPPENNTNYLWEYETGKWAIVLNTDKIENKRLKKAYLDKFSGSKTRFRA